MSSLQSSEEYKEVWLQFVNETASHLSVSETVSECTLLEATFSVTVPCGDLRAAFYRVIFHIVDVVQV